MTVEYGRVSRTVYLENNTLYTVKTRKDQKEIKITKRTFEHFCRSSLKAGSIFLWWSAVSLQLENSIWIFLLLLHFVQTQAFYVQFGD